MINLVSGRKEGDKRSNTSTTSKNYEKGEKKGFYTQKGFLSINYYYIIII